MDKNKKEIIYLASPYSHHDDRIIRKRFNHICHIASNMIKDGLLVYCPIAHSHPIAEQGLFDNWQTWQELDSEMLNRCDIFWIAPMEGWDNSLGVREERKKAEELGMRVEFVPDKYLTL